MFSLTRWLIRSVPSDRVRMILCKRIGITAGKGSIIRFGAEFNLPCVEIGSNVFVNYRCHFDTGWGGEAKISIGDNVRVAMDVAFICVSHEIGGPERRAAKDTYKDIVVGKGVWVGARSTILQGVSIGEGTIIGAGSLVLDDCEPNCLYAGVPARLIKRLD